MSDCPVPLLRQLARRAAQSSRPARPSARGPCAEQEQKSNHLTPPFQDLQSSYQPTQIGSLGGHTGRPAGRQLST